MSQKWELIVDTPGFGMKGVILPEDHKGLVRACLGITCNPNEYPHIFRKVEKKKCLVSRPMTETECVQWVSQYPNTFVIEEQD